MAFDRYSPPETRLFADQMRICIGIIAVLMVLLAVVLANLSPNRPVKRQSETEHFFYGSIGSDLSGGIPAKVLPLLPALFPQHLPAGAAPDLTAFGFIQEPGERLPIGFSQRRQVIDRTGLNCAACHVGVVREKPGGQPTIIPGMPANTVDLYAYFRFLFDVAADEDFTADTILDALDARGEKGWLDGLIFRIGIPIMRDALLVRERRNRFFFEPGYTPFLPGRVNTFDTFKVDQFRAFYRQHNQPLDPDEMYGIVDFPSVWNQQLRDGIWLHWDGNQSSVRERNFSAAIGAGVKPHEMDIDSLFRIERWLRDLPAPPYPFDIDKDLAVRGKPVYEKHCARCHELGQPGLAKVMPVSRIGTDPYRERSYSDFVRRAQIDYTRGHFWQFKRFRDTDGYVAHPLDGIWARAPYLHNGSVPSLFDLLTAAGDRPRAFEVGVDVYDADRAGFAALRLLPTETGFQTTNGTAYSGGYSIFDTRLKGNAATGHSGPQFGTELPDAEKRALIEYLITL